MFAFPEHGLIRRGPTIPNDRLTMEHRTIMYGTLPPSFVALFFLTLALGISGPAFADVPPPNPGGCVNAGDACGTTEVPQGVCVQSTCTQTVVNHAVPDAVPQTREYSCLDCRPGEPTTQGTWFGCTVTDSKRTPTGSVAFVLFVTVIALRRRIIRPRP